MKSKNSARSRRTERAAKSSGDTVSRLRRRAMEAETEAQAQTDTQPVPATNSATMSIGGVQIPNLQLGNMEGTVRNVVSYLQENPLSAAAMALGAGVVLTSMYWDQASEARGKQRSR